MDKVEELAIWTKNLTQNTVPLSNRQEDSLSVPQKQVDIPQKQADIVCFNCEKKIPHNSRYCPCCGVLLYVRCPKCGYKYSSQFPFCSQCGTDRLSEEKKREVLYAVILSLLVHKENEKEEKLRQMRIALERKKKEKEEEEEKRKERRRQKRKEYEERRRQKRKEHEEWLKTPAGQKEIQRKKREEEQRRLEEAEERRKRELQEEQRRLDEAKKRRYEDIIDQVYIYAIIIFFLFVATFIYSLFV